MLKSFFCCSFLVDANTFGPFEILIWNSVEDIKMMGLILNPDLVKWKINSVNIESLHIKMLERKIGRRKKCFDQKWHFKRPILALTR